MKKLLLTLTLTLTAHSFAFAEEVIVEFDQTQEMKCLQEVQALGCESSSDTKTMKCLEAKKNKLSKTCRDMHTTKVKTRK